ncbi:MAG: hypothetical protein P9X26_07210, partial [Candidatus Stygibacter frigidus]|nr:hypothetical protein [Candidatus Stygibacter frigidus]
MNCRKMFLIVAVLFLFYNIAFAGVTIDGKITLDGGLGDETQAKVTLQFERWSNDMVVSVSDSTGYPNENGDYEFVIEYVLTDSIKIVYIQTTDLFSYDDSTYVYQNAPWLKDGGAETVDFELVYVPYQVDITGISTFSINYLQNNNHLHGDSLDIECRTVGYSLIGGFRYYSSIDTTNWELIGENILPDNGWEFADTFEGWDVNVIDEGVIYIGVVPTLNDPLNNEFPTNWLEVYIDHTVGMTDDNVTNDIEPIMEGTQTILFEIEDIDDIFSSEFGCYWLNEDGEQDSSFANFNFGAALDYYTLTLNAVPDGLYDFHIYAIDNSIPVKNEQDFIVKQGIYVDNDPPDVVDFTISENDLVNNIPILPANTYTFNFNGNDEGTGFASVKVEMRFDDPTGNIIPNDGIIWDNQYVIGTANDLPLERTIDMSEFPLGDYEIEITLTDHSDDENDLNHPETEMFSFELKSANIIATPYIAAIDECDVSECDIDIYAITQECDVNQEPTQLVRFERLDGDEWTDIGNATPDLASTADVTLWKLSFNYDEYYGEIADHNIRAVSYSMISGNIYEKYSPSIIPQDVSTPLPMTADSDARIVANNVALSTKSI